MSETDDKFWEDMYERYVGGWVEEDFSFEDKQALIIGEGNAKDKFHNSIFNRIFGAGLKSNRHIEGGA